MGGRASQVRRAGATEFELAPRLDWRFLLPEPQLGRVALVNAAESLQAALRLACGTANVVEADPNVVEADAGAAPPGAHFDLVVARVDSSDALRRAASLLRPGGWLYLEAGRAGRLGRAARALAAMRSAGLTDVRAYWHWPDHERCREIVALDAGSALRYALGRRRGSARARLLAPLARLAARLRLLPLVVGSFSVLGRRPQ